MFLLNYELLSYCYIRKNFFDSIILENLVQLLEICLILPKSRIYPVYNIANMSLKTVVCIILKKILKDRTLSITKNSFFWQ